GGGLGGSVLSGGSLGDGLFSSGGGLLSDGGGLSGDLSGNYGLVSVRVLGLALESVSGSLDGGGLGGNLLGNLSRGCFGGNVRSGGGLFGNGCLSGDFSRNYGLISVSVLTCESSGREGKEDEEPHVDE
ncbi:hypothetical protein PMAYCL1PPCAC_17659, partial [Pristionchus mayeri]